MNVVNVGNPQAINLPKSVSMVGVPSPLMVRVEFQGRPAETSCQGKDQGAERVFRFFPGGHWGKHLQIVVFPRSVLKHGNTEMII